MGITKLACRSRGGKLGSCQALRSGRPLAGRRQAEGWGLGQLVGRLHCCGDPCTQAGHSSRGLVAPWWETSARACWVQCWAGGTALLRVPSCLDPEGTGSPDVPAPSPAAAPRPRTPRQPLPQRQSLSPSPSRGRCLMLGAGAPWAWGDCGTGPPSHVSPTARGEQRGAVPISTQGFYQPPPRSQQPQ